MKRKVSLITGSLFICLLFCTCTIKKRVYMRGYYIDWLNFASTKPAWTPKKLVRSTANAYDALAVKASCERVINAEEKNELFFEEGTWIEIPENAFVYANGTEIKCSQVNIMVKEFYLKSDIIESGLTTTSNRKLLVSGGMIYIEAKCCGAELVLRKGKKLKVKMPVHEEYATDMRIFSGQMDKGLMDWKLEGRTSQSDLPESDDSLSYVSENDYSEREGEAGNEAYLMEVTTLGWINCDRFYDNKNPTTLYVLADTLKGTSIALVFKDIKSVMPGYLYNNNTTEFKNVPVGQDVTVLAYQVDRKKQQAMVARQDLVIGKKDSVLMNLEPMSLTDFKMMLKEFN